MATIVKLVSMSQVDADYAAEISEGDEATLTLLGAPEGLCAYVARVSSPTQTNPEYAKLLKYCMANGHWSVFEQVSATFEVTTSLAIAAQLLRHRSFCFQQFSARYAKVPDSYEVFEARSQDKKNRQASHDDMDQTTKDWWNGVQKNAWDASFHYYNEALNKGIAKETARAILPVATTTRLFVSGNLRSFLHYINVRADAATQKEHREIAEAMKAVLISKTPIIAEACEWVETKKEP
jgi:thymidylate synthase (FAD)